MNKIKEILLKILISYYKNELKKEYKIFYNTRRKKIMTDAVISENEISFFILKLDIDVINSIFNKKDKQVNLYNHIDDIANKLLSFINNKINCIYNFIDVNNLQYYNINEVNDNKFISSYNKELINYYLRNYTKQKKYI